MPAFARSESESRIARLQQLMKPAGLDGCLVTQNVGIYYLTGSMQSGFVFIPADGPATYYVKRSLKRAEHESFVRVAALGAMRQFGDQLKRDYPDTFADGGGKSAGRPAIGADLDVMPAQLYLRLIEAISRAEWRDASGLLGRLRSVKSLYEIGRIEAAARVAAISLEEGLRSLREGMTELELMAVIERKMREAGHIGLMRMRGYNQELVTGMVTAGGAAAD